MVGVLTPEQQNRSRQITKLEGGFGALNPRFAGGGALNAPTFSAEL